MAEEEQQLEEQVEEGFEEQEYEGDAMEGGEGEEHAPEEIDELETIKQKLREMEEEAARLREAQGKAAVDGATPGSEGAEPGSKEEADSRSIFVGNVDWGTTPEELQLHFQSCGTVNRVTILTEKDGNPKGYAYIEFLETDAVDNACLLDNSELRGRNIKVARKRTNQPGMKNRGRGRGRGRGYYARGAPRGRGYGYGYGYGYVPRGRGRGRGYAPY